MPPRKKGASGARAAEPSAVDTPKATAEGRNALRSPSRLAGWVVLMLRFAVYLTAALLAEVLLEAYLGPDSEGTDE